jgi:hypothetical protein
VGNGRSEMLILVVRNAGFVNLTRVTTVEIIRITKVIESSASVSPYIYTMLVDFVVF